MFHRSWAILLAGLALLGQTRDIDAEGHMPDPLVDVWETDAGLPNSTVTGITQTPDGYLWVGTYNGLVRFDGARFVTFDPGNTPELRNARVQGLYVDTTGTLWITTYRGTLTSYRDGAFHAEPTLQRGFDLHTVLAYSTSDEVLFIGQLGEVMRKSMLGPAPLWKVTTRPERLRPIFQCADGDGVLWFLTGDGKITRFINGEFVDLPNSGGLTNPVTTLVADSRRRIWAGAKNEVAIWTGRRFTNVTATNEEPSFEPELLLPTRAGALWVLSGDRLREQIDRRWVAEAVEWRGLLGVTGGRAVGAHEDAEGGVWFNDYGNGVFHIFPNGKFQHLTTRNGLTGDRVGAWFQARDSGIWLGIDHGGLARLRDRPFQVLGVAEGLPARSALSVCQGADGGMWFGTGGGGLCRWQNGTIKSFKVASDPAEDFIFSVFPRADGGLWLSDGTEDLAEFVDGNIRPAPWKERGVKAILTDRQGRLWIGSKSGLSWRSAAESGTFGSAEGMADSPVRALALAPDGAVWCGADDGAIRHCETNHVVVYRAKDGPTDQPIWSLLVDKQGVVWAGTFRSGLLRFKDGKFNRFTTKQGLYADVVAQILEDNQNRLWLGTDRGIFCVNKSALDDCAEGRAAAINCVTYGRLDGLPTLEMADGFQPTCWKDTEGRLWFATVRGVVSVRPDELTAHPAPPPVVIEEVSVDGERIPLSEGKLVIRPGHKQYDFRFTAMSFDAPDKTRFRCRIDGLDDTWVETDTRRTAHYGKLPPNEYRFRVTACSSEGVWNKTEASVNFVVEPFFYQRGWFVALACISILGGGAVVARVSAARKFQRELARLEQQNAVERDRARIARDIHDDMGAGLTQITLLSELARREPGEISMHLERISNSARHLTRAMDEIVWAVDPQHDTFEGLIDYISVFAEEFLRIAGIRCRLDLPTALPNLRVGAELRHNLFLAVKEALNNVVKHSKATETWLRLRMEDDGFTVVVEDNGCGCEFDGLDAQSNSDGERLAGGSGLPNLRRRLAAIGGNCVLRSQPGRGMQVELRIRLADGVVADGEAKRNGSKPVS